MITFTQLGKQGRIGNQLFELAATIALALRNNDSYIFPPWDLEPYFNLHNCFSSNIVPTITYKEPHFHYAPIPYTDTKNQVLDIVGFWQSYKYFSDYEGVIRGLLTPNIRHGILWDHTAIHWRRGDYTQLTQEYVQLDMNYYQKAMDMVKSKYYIVFSDDITWCKSQFKQPNVIFSEGKSPVEDLSLMAACENSIIGNSSFSWWGAWLNPNPSKIVVSPQKWFGPKLPHDTKDLLPPEWLRA